MESRQGELVNKIFIVLGALAGLAAGGPRYIGVVTAPGPFWIDGTGVTEHATMFEGSSVETNGDAVKIELNNTVQALLDAGSRARVYGNHLVLEKGRCQLDRGADYQIEARSMQIGLGSPQSRVVVAISDTGVVEVGALAGEARVLNTSGIEVSRVETGRTVELRPAEGQDTSVLRGCVSKVPKAYVMRDEASGINVELRGAEIGRAVGSRIEVRGAMAPKARASAPAAQVIEAAEIKIIGTGCATTITAAGTGSRARVAPAHAGGVASAGSGGGVPTAVIGGVAVAAGAGGAAAVVVAQSHKPPISRGR